MSARGAACHALGEHAAGYPTPLWFPCTQKTNELAFDVACSLLSLCASRRLAILCLNAEM